MKLLNFSKYLYNAMTSNKGSEIWTLFLFEGTAPTTLEGASFDTNSLTELVNNSIEMVGTAVSRKTVNYPQVSFPIGVDFGGGGKTTKFYNGGTEVGAIATPFKLHRIIGRAETAAGTTNGAWPSISGTRPFDYLDKDNPASYTVDNLFNSLIDSGLAHSLYNRLNLGYKNSTTYRLARSHRLNLQAIQDVDFIYIAGSDQAFAQSFQTRFYYIPEGSTSWTQVSSPTAVFVQENQTIILLPSRVRTRDIALQFMPLTGSPNLSLQSLFASGMTVGKFIDTEASPTWGVLAKLDRTSEASILKNMLVTGQSITNFNGNTSSVTLNLSNVVGDL